MTDGLPLLLEKLAAVDQLRWVRFLYAYPNKITRRLLETIASHEKICSYIDVPLQHASAPALKRMKPDVYTVGEVWEPISIQATYYPDQLESYFTFELADAIIRIIDTYQKWRRLQAADNIETPTIGELIILKHEYNITRPHKHGRTC